MLRSALSALQHANQVNWSRSAIRSRPLLPNLASLSCIRWIHASKGAQAITPYILTDVGEGIYDVEILQWYVKEGDDIQEFDKVCEVQSDKATLEISSRYTGKVIKLHYDKGDMAKVREPLMDIDVEGGEDNKSDEPSPAASSASEPSATPSQTASSTSPSASTAPVDGGKILTTPAVRRLLKENNLSASDVVAFATGKDGRLLKEDVLAAIRGNHPAATPTPAAAPASSPSATAPTTSKATAADWEVPMRGYQRIMFKSMTASLSIPHFGFSDEYGMDALIELRATLNKQLAASPTAAGVAKLSFMPFFIKAASLALHDYPILNASVTSDGNNIHYHGSHNIGMAVDSPNGLVVPNIKGVQDLTILDIAAEVGRLAAAGRAGNLSMDDLNGTTFTLSNVGTIGGTYASPVISPPQVAIGAMGKMQRLPRFDAQGGVVAQNLLQISWSADHRVVDGATMARFSEVMKECLENPVSMIARMR
jgi:2-oxoisovalerate dehydrogenase E2 component (dihydrolipoyl transacylase)